MNDSFVVLFDYDSMIYKAVWKVASSFDRADPPPADYPRSYRIRRWFEEGRSRKWMETEIIHLTVNRMSNMGDGILSDIEDTGINIDGVEYFLTSCPNSRRKKIYPDYKANRKKNKWVNMVRKYILDMGFAHTHDEWEADDLIKDRAVELGVDRCVICTVDKDLQQIPGIHFDYYRPRLVYPNGEPMTDRWGNRLIAPCRGLKIFTHKQSDLFFWTQMLTGDSTDNIKGIRGIGPKTAEKILKGSEDYQTTVHQAYIDALGPTEGQEQFEIHLLLIGLGVQYRPEKYIL